MEKIKDFVNSISKTGWIIVGVVVIILILLITGFLLVKKEGSVWTLNKEASTGDSQEFKLDLEDNFNGNKDNTNDLVFSSEDVSRGEYDNSVEAANLFVKNTREVQVAVVIDDEKYAIANSKDLSCGKLAFVTVRVPDNVGIINETLKAVFGDKVSTDFFPGNIIPKYHPNLVFDSAILEDGVVQIYLRGDFSTLKNGKCDISLAISQITETVKQFSGIKEVEIYQNLNRIN